MKEPKTNFEQIPVATVKKIAQEFSASSENGSGHEKAYPFPRFVPSPANPDGILLRQGGRRRGES